MSAQESLVCPRCQPVEVENAQLKQACESVSQENTNLAIELQGSRGTIRTLERQIVKLRVDLERAAEDDPKAREIKSILEFWRSTTGHTRARVDVSSEKGKLVKGQLRFYNATDLQHAIKGATLKPYVRFGARYVNGAKEDLQTQLEHCIGPKPASRVEKNIEIYRAACKVAVDQADQMWQFHQKLVAQQMVSSRLVLDAAAAVEAGIEGEDLEALLLAEQSVQDARFDDLFAGLSEPPKLRLVAA